MQSKSGWMDGWLASGHIGSQRFASVTHQHYRLIVSHHTFKSFNPDYII